ncbi:hypothetical protein ACFOY4_18740 [Actinomadura syzygii]|uniref:hypothetical protein n=1 Tax=Actinomadura syzygii TaxID=1427538 RepID=UPI001652B25D|nr:hypothetical protein [Actinomadura syzygii]
MAEAELATHTARFLGWNRRGSDISLAFVDDLLRLQDEGLIEGVPDRILLR